jgi:hypothetical protein
MHPGRMGRVEEIQSPPRDCAMHLDYLAVFKIEVFNALQTRFGPSKYTSIKTALQNATPNSK